jgi:hypothetical protein
MVMRIVTFVLAGAVVLGGPAAAALANDAPREREREAFIRRDDDDDAELAVRELDDDTDDSGGDSGGFTSGVNSNDGTNSRSTNVTHDQDLSRGDLTRDRTDDGAGGPKRDWSRHQTNDSTRRDSR